MMRQKMGTIFLVLAVLGSLAGIVLYWLNTHGAYYSDFAMEIMVYAILGVVTLVVVKLLSVTRGEKWWVDILYIVAAFFFSWAAISFLGDRVESAAIILGSRLEAGNVIAKQSLFMSFAAVGCFILSMLMTGVAGFFDQHKI